MAGQDDFSQQFSMMSKKVAIDVLNGRMPFDQWPEGGQSAGMARSPYGSNVGNSPVPKVPVPGFGYSQASNAFPAPVHASAIANPKLTTPGIRIELEKDELWREFQGQTTEMVVTKSGRRMFPSLRFRVSGLDPAATYGFYVVFTPVDTLRYKFQHGKWSATVFNDSANMPHSIPTYQHPDSPAPGRMWMSQPLSFHRIKLTNCPKADGDMVLLNSMHKYQPRLVAVKLHQNFNGQPVQIVAEFAPPETQFIAVTAYQNQNITKLKVQHNPFAKGFRQNAERAATESPSSPIQDRKRKAPSVGLDLSSKRISVQPEASRETSPTPAYGPVQQFDPHWPPVSNPMHALYLAAEMAKAAVDVRTVTNGFYQRQSAVPPISAISLMNRPTPAFYSPVLAPRPYPVLMNPIGVPDVRLPAIDALWPTMAGSPYGPFGGPDPGVRFSMY